MNHFVTPLLKCVVIFAEKTFQKIVCRSTRRDEIGMGDLGAVGAHAHVAAREHRRVLGRRHADHALLPRFARSRFGQHS